MPEDIPPELDFVDSLSAFAGASPDKKVDIIRSWNDADREFLLAISKTPFELRRDPGVLLFKQSKAIRNDESMDLDIRTAVANLLENHAAIYLLSDEDMELLRTELPKDIQK